MIRVLHTGDVHLGDMAGPTKDGVNLRRLDTLACMPKPQEGRNQLPRCRECEKAVSSQQGKRGKSYTCGITGDHVDGRYTRTSPPWCPIMLAGRTSLTKQSR